MVARRLVTESWGEWRGSGGEWRGSGGGGVASKGQQRRGKQRSLDTGNGGSRENVRAGGKEGN